MRTGFLTAILLLTLPGWVSSAAQAKSPTAPASGAADSSAGGLRLREGEQLEATGRLELSGDRAIFYPGESKSGLRVLENLALERITQVLSESREQRQWIVSGTIMEYRGANYILIHKAVQCANTAAAK